MPATSQIQTKFEDYEGFVEKFKPKKTTDDCYTPPAVYQCVKNWACKKYGIDPEKTVRPFYPGGDYENFEYQDGVVVLDNPPFSILAQIIKFYKNREIPYFLFCSELTAINLTRSNGAGIIYADASIVYENGAQVKTAFATSFGDNIVEVAPDLKEMLVEIQKKNAPPLPVYETPPNVLSVKTITLLSRRGVPFTIKRTDAAFINNLDAMKHVGKSIFGGALLLSDKAAADKAAADKAAADKAAADKAAADKAAADKARAIRFELSEREKQIIKYLNEQRALCGGVT